MANLFVRDCKTATDLVEEIDTKDMDNIFTDRITSVCWYYIVETADVPLCFASTVDVEIIVALGGCSVPLSL